MPVRTVKPAPQPAHRKSPLRSLLGSRRGILGVLIGLAVGLLVVGLVRPWSGGTPLAPSPTSGPGSGVVPKSAVHASNVAADLNDEWQQFSNLSTCSQWAGADGMGAVRLSPTQIAWFFSDTYMGPATPTTGFRKASGLTHNSVVIQTTRSSSNRFVTVTGGNTCQGFSSQPDSVIQGAKDAPGRASSRYWAEGGIKVGSTVYQFYQRYTSGNVPYIAQGTVLAEYPVSALEAAGTSPQASVTMTPNIDDLGYYTMPGQTVPAAKRSSLVWGASVTQAGDMVYIYGTWTPTSADPNRSLYLARVPASQLGDFSSWRFYAGPGKWASSQTDAVALTRSITLGISSGFSVIKSNGLYWLIEADPLSGSSDLDAIASTNPWGPFYVQNKLVLYSDPGIGLDAAHDYMLMYEARADPAVSPDGSIVIGYNVNSTAISTGCTPLSWFTNTLTLPRFVSVPLANLSLSKDRPASGVVAGTSSNPDVISEDPGQWVNQWLYPSSCPPIPALGAVAAKPEDGGVQLSFPDLGLGFGYQVYLRKAGAAKSTLKKWMSWDLTFHSHQESVKLTGMSPGTYQVQVVPVNANLRTGKASNVTVTVP
jgi:hypothetical protein